MNTVLMELTNDMKSELMETIGIPIVGNKFRVNINLTGYNYIKDLIGFYLNGIFKDKKHYYFRNGIMEIEDTPIDSKDKIFLLILTNYTNRGFISSYTLKNYEVTDDNKILLNDDNEDLTKIYSIKGIIVNGVMYSDGEIEVSKNKDEIKFFNFPLKKTDNIKLLINQIYDGYKDTSQFQNSN